MLTSLHWARFAVYRHSSEILHGTFFGAAFFLGVTDPAGPPRSPEQLLARIAGQHLMVLLAGALSVDAVVRAVHAAFDVPELLQATHDLMTEMGRAPFFAGPSEGAAEAQQWFEPGGVGRGPESCSACT